MAWFADTKCTLCERRLRGRCGNCWRNYCEYCIAVHLPCGQRNAHRVKEATAHAVAMTRAFWKEDAASKAASAAASHKPAASPKPAASAAAAEKVPQYQ